MTYKTKLLPLVFITFFMLISHFSWANNHHINILIINSYHQDYPWTLGQNNAFKKQIKAQFPHSDIKFTTENLNTKQVELTESYHHSFIDYFHEKYQHNIPDLIYITDDNAINIVLDHLSDIHRYADIPIIFSGINNVQLLAPHDTTNVTGVFEYKNIEANVSLLKQLNVQFNTVLWVGDGGTSDAEVSKQFAQVQQAYPDIKIIQIADCQLSQLISLINKQPQIGRAHV